MHDSSLPKMFDQRLFPAIWTLVALKTLLPWLVFFRLTFEGSSYQWGMSLFGKMYYSAGLSRPDFLLIYVLLAAGIFLLYQMRKSNFSVAAPVLLAYFTIFAADALYNLVLGDPFIFQGDTLGVRVDISIPFFVLHFGAFALALAWWWGLRGVRIDARERALTRAKRMIIKACIAFLPVQLILLIFGEPHGTTDAIGVVGTLVQWVLLAWALYPGANYRAN